MKEKPVNHTTSATAVERYPKKIHGSEMGARIKKSACSKRNAPPSVARTMCIFVKRSRLDGCLFTIRVFKNTKSAVAIISTSAIIPERFAMPIPEKSKSAKKRAVPGIEFQGLGILFAKSCMEIKANRCVVIPRYKDLFKTFHTRSYDL
jgi:hypothetical protein